MMTVNKFPKTSNKNVKAKRWKKGHSSDSNPIIKRHRVQAKSRFFNYNQQSNSNLTVKALEEHDKSQNDGIDDAMSSSNVLDVQSQSSDKTALSWATNFTACTNTSFGRLLRYTNSNTAAHKEALAVLAAVTEVIKEQDGKETETEYFTVLMTTLNNVDDVESVAAVVYLLSLVMKKVPVPVLKSQFSLTSKILMETLEKYIEESSVALIRSLLYCVSHLLRVQDYSIWNDSSTVHIFSDILAFTTHTKPKVRKAAHHALSVILKASNFMLTENSPPHHPATSATAAHIIKIIEKSGGDDGNTSTLHILGLLKDIIQTFPLKCLKTICESILRLMTLSDVLITSNSLRALYCLFHSRPKASNLSVELNAQMITALYDFIPSINDIQPLNAWLAVLEKAHINLAILKPDLCLAHLPKFFSTCMKGFLSEKNEVAISTAGVLKSVLRECLAASEEASIQLINSSTENAPSPIQRMFMSVEIGIGYQYHSSWPYILQVLATFYEVMGKHCYFFMKKSLTSLASLRDSFQFPYIHDLDKAIGAAIAAMGPEKVLDAIPLLITGEHDDINFPRSWLIPLLKRYVSNTELSYFISYFLPLAQKMKDKSLFYKNKNSSVEANAYDTLHLQIWSLFPGFCTSPNDMKKSFRAVAKTLGSTLQNNEAIRSDVLNGLRKLINCSLNDEESKQEMGRYAKNFLPILFNMYSCGSDKSNNKSNLATLETIKVYMNVADETLIQTFFNKSLSVLEDDDTLSNKRHSLMDILIAMIPHFNKELLLKTMEFITPNLQSEDHTVQKKSYRILEEICSSSREETKAFISESLSSLHKSLIDSVSDVNSSSKAPRLRCLIYIMKCSESYNMEFFSSILPEVILCTKELAEKARIAAFDLLKVMGQRLIYWDKDRAEEDVCNEFFGLLMAGYAGSLQMITATNFSIMYCLVHFRENISSSLLKVIIESNCELLKSASGEVLVSALRLLKVIISNFPVTSVGQFLSDIVCAIVSMDRDNQHKNRKLIKNVLSKLIAKYSFDAVQKYIPDNMNKLISNIRKTQARAKKLKNSQDSDDEDSDVEDITKNKPESFEDLIADSDSDSDDDSHKKKSKTKINKASKKAGAAWIKENSGDNIVDFLDYSVNRKVLASKPNTVKKERPEHGFKLAADGRFIITAENDEGKVNEKHNQGEIDDLAELFDAMEKPGKKIKKRKMESFDKDFADDDDEVPMKYQAGGSGIHRPIAVPKSKRNEEVPGNEYKAKKAGGDMKRKGKPDPYAYVPLDFKSLNKRKKAKVSGTFKNFINSANKGSAKGKKQHGKKKSS